MMNKDVSRRVRRMDRRHKFSKASPLNLVSLMDIFTILVFFLLVNSSSVPQLPNSRDLKLPKSIAKKVPANTLTIAITREAILVQGRRVALISEVRNMPETHIKGLIDELRFLAGKPTDEKRSVTILGDENTSYDVISKILKSCQQENFTNIAFAADQVAEIK